jgi:hypothetical protein
MKITICGSIAFFDEMLAIKEKLQQLGHEVDLPPLETKDENGQTISIKEFMVKKKPKQITKAGFGTEKRNLLECILKKSTGPTWY